MKKNKLLLILLIILCSLLVFSFFLSSEFDQAFSPPPNFSTISNEEIISILSNPASPEAMISGVVFELSKKEKLSSNEVTALLQALNHVQSTDALIGIVHALSKTTGEFDTPKVITVLITHLSDSNISVREQAAVTLSQLVNPSSLLSIEQIEKIIFSLENPSEKVVQYSTITVGKIGIKAEKSLPILLRNLNHKNQFIRGNSALALEKITGEKVSQISDDWNSFSFDEKNKDLFIVLKAKKEFEVN